MERVRPRLPFIRVGHYAACVLGSDRWRKVGLVLDVLLHGTIILTMGLWSFALVMIGTSTIAALPMRKAPTEKTPAEEANDTGGPKRAGAAAPVGAT